MRGLYAITPDLLSTETLERLVRQALDGGIALLQYRNKIADAVLRKEQAVALLHLTRARRVPLSGSFAWGMLAKSMSKNL